MGSAPSAGEDEITTGPADLIRVLPAGTMDRVAIEDHLEAAVAAGFDAVSLRPRHLRSWLDDGGRGLVALAARLRSLALGVSELDPVTGWSDPRDWPSTELPTSVLGELDMAATLGAGAVTALVAPGEPWESGPGAEGLHALCAAAAEREVLVQVEPFGWSALWDVVAAAEVIRGIGAPNAGVLIDTWHLQRRGGGPATVAALEVGEVLGLQVADGPARPATDDLQVDCFAARTWPGEPGGEQHPERILAALLDRGWSGPVAVEVFGDASADPIGRAHRAATATDVMLARTGRNGDG